MKENIAKNHMCEFFGQTINIKLSSKNTLSAEGELIMKQQLTDDKPLMAFLIGVIICIPIELTSILFKRLGVTTVTNGEACSMMFIPQGSWTLGLLALPSVAGLAILVFYLLTPILGTTHLPIKGIIVGMTTKAFVFAIWGTLAKNHYLIQNTSGNYFHSFNAGFAGFLAGILMQKYLFNETSQQVKLRPSLILPSSAMKQCKPIELTRTKLRKKR